MITMIFGRKIVDNTNFADSKKLSPILCPEKFLHPVDQLGLMDDFIYAHNEGIDEVIITHSEYMLARLQTRIADGTIKKEDVELWNVRGKVGTRLIVNDAGDIENYPKDFFGDLLGEISNRVINHLDKKLKNFCYLPSSHSAYPIAQAANKYQNKHQIIPIINPIDLGEF